jgi:hypothetical protein
MKTRFFLLLLLGWAATQTIAQNVGVGMATPGSKLTVRGNGSTNASSALDVTNSVGTSMLYVRDDGRVGIGTTAPAQRLHVEGGQILVNNTGDLSSIRFKYDNSLANTNSCNYLDFENSAGNRWIQYEGGPNLGYYGVSPNAMEWWYYPSGAIPSQCCHRRFVILPTAGTYTGGMTVVIDGIGQMYGNGWSQPSDATLKEGITKIDLPLQKLKQLGGYTYEYTEASGLDNGRRRAGVLAQEVEAVLPEAVSPSPQGDFKTVNYDALIPLLIEAMKAQQTEIEKQGKQIAEQQQRIEELTK